MKLVFSSFPEFSDNSLMILRSVIQQEIHAKCIWLVNDVKNLPAIKEKANKYIGINTDKIVFVKKNSILGIYHFLTAHFVFETHGMFEQFPLLPWQKKINLWHGMPLKRIGRLSGNPIKLKMDATISTAPIFDEVMATSFEIPTDKIMKIGQPRNDLFFEPTKMNFELLFNNKNRTIAWLPTYRQSDVGDVRVDGVQEVDSVGGISKSALEKLDQVLIVQHINLAIKLHPMDILNDQLGEFDQFTNIKFLTKKNFANLNIEVNDFLNATVGLITDYSSVYFDYILTGNPIGILQLDKNSYAGGRGFVSDEVAQEFEGINISSLTDFINFIENIGLKQDDQAFWKQKVRLFDSYDRTGKNSRELLKLLDLK